MKRVIVVALYEADVPEDMDLEEIRSSAEERIRDRLYSFNISTDYHDEDESQPIFDLDSVKCGSNYSVTVDGVTSLSL